MARAPLRTPLFAANWKMNLGPAEARDFMRAFVADAPPRDDRTIAFFPPALSLAAVREGAAGTDLRFGVQNIHWEEKGAFTGELSAAMAGQAGAELVLVGHSERRHVFGERDEESGRKVAAAASQDLVPVLCVGEQLDERERGETEAVVLRQLRVGIAGLAPDGVAAMVVAYEPVWAIGTGRTATATDATAVHGAIRAALREAIGARAAAVPILYGGSVSEKNVAALLSAGEVDGVLVGREPRPGGMGANHAHLTGVREGSKFMRFQDIQR